MDGRLHAGFPADIMIVDDAPENLDMLVAILGDMPCAVRAATNAEAALAAARRKAPDLALIDVRLPGMDGLALCREFKRDPALRDVPVIFTSGLAGGQDIRHAFQAGGVDYIVKPYRSEEVLARVATQLELARLRRKLDGYRVKFGELEE